MSVTIPISKEKLKVKTNNWVNIQELIKEPNSINVFEFDYSSELLAIASYLNKVGLGILRLHVYHDCEEEHPVKLIQLNQGVASGPCPNCKKIFKEENVKYDVELITKFNLKLED